VAVAEKLLITEREAAELLSVSERTLFNLRRAGEIDAVQLRGCVRYSVAALQEYIAKQAGSAK
jgi:excisionase family DNA binding protein